MDCLQEECMAWSGSDCRMFAVPVMISSLTTGTQNGAQGSAIQPVTTEEATEITEVKNEDKQEKKNPVAKLNVLEFSVTKNGNTRAKCKVEGGNEDQLIIAKNGVGRTLQEGLNKTFTVEYNVMKDGETWYVIKAKRL